MRRIPPVRFIRHSPPFGIAPKIVWCELGNTNLGCEFRDDVPYGLLRYAFAPSSTRAAHTPEKPPGFNSGSLCPFVDQAIHPSGDGNGSDVTCFSTQVHDRPMPFALLQVAESQLADLMATESAGQQDTEKLAITFAPQPLPAWRLPKCLPLSGTDLFSHVPLPPSYSSPPSTRLPSCQPG